MIALHLENKVLKDEVVSLKEDKEKLENTSNNLKEEYKSFEGLYHKAEYRANEAEATL